MAAHGASLVNTALIHFIDLPLHELLRRLNIYQSRAPVANPGRLYAKSSSALVIFVSASRLPRILQVLGSPHSMQRTLDSAKRAG
jgi:hypothetical protein